MTPPTKLSADSDYVPETSASDTDTELDPTTTDADPTNTEPDSTDSDHPRAASGGGRAPANITLFDLSEDEYQELQETIFDLAEEFLKHEGLAMSQTGFKDKTTKHVFDILIDDLIESEIFTYDHYDDIKEICKEVVDLYFDSLQIPDYVFAETSDKDASNPDKRYLYDQIRFLRAQPQTAQKSEEWYRERHSLMTASNIWKPLGSQAQQNSFIAEKCTPFVLQAYQQTGGGGYCNTASPMHWGNKYEPVTRMVYEHKYTTVVEDFGCIKHGSYPFIGASPDGINVDPESPRYGRMVEIKNIFNRDITGVPSDKYWIQVQIQLETCGLDLCDFIETRFKEYAEPEFYVDQTHEYRGIILYFVEPGSQPPIYEYMPLWVKLEYAVIQQWIRSQLDAHPQYTLYDTLYWYLDEMSCITIERNRKWFEQAVVKLTEIKTTIDHETVTGFQHRLSTRSTKLQKSAQPPICLVKLDENGNAHAAGPNEWAVETTANNNPG
jgi:putative phage-type endonuclease